MMTALILVTWNMLAILGLVWVIHIVYKALRGE